MGLHRHLRLCGSRINFLTLNKGYKSHRLSDAMLNVLVFTTKIISLNMFLSFAGFKT